MKLGININKLRKEKEFTQEQLADCIGVSIAAVSKWETGSAYPDIELLPKLAEIFGVSVDYLLGYDMKKSDMTIGEHIKIADELVYSRKAKEAIEYFNKIAIRYPHNIKVKLNQARYYIFGTYGTNTNDYKKQLLRDAENILLSVHDNILIRDEYDFKYSYLAFLYKIDKRYTDSLEMIKKIKSHNNIDINSMEAEIYNLLGDKNTAVCLKQKNLLSAIKNTSGGFYSIYYNEPEKIIFYNNLHLNILLEVTSDIPSMLDADIGTAYETNAYMYARLGDKEKALCSFEKAVEYAIRFESNNTNSYSVIPYFDMINENEFDSAQCNQITAILTALKSNERTEYDLIKDEPLFIKLIEKMNNTQK